MTETSEITVTSNGTRWWYLYGKLHRTDGAAVEYFNGTRAWYLYGKLHRTDGPAVERADCTRDWYLHGEQLTFEQWLEQHKLNPAERTMLALRWG